MASSNVSISEEIRIIVKFLVKENETTERIFRRLKAVYGENVISEVRLNELVENFKKEDDTITVEPKAKRLRK